MRGRNVRRIALLSVVAWTRRCRAWGRAVRAFGLTLLWFGTALVSPSLAAEFESPPVVDHRRVELRWQPDADDPFYNGNTVLLISRRLDLIHSPGERVQFVRLTNLTGEGYSYAAGDDVIKRWRVSDGMILSELPIPAGEEPVDLAIHPSNASLLMAFRSGRVAIWDTRTNNPPSVFEVSDSPLHQVMFYRGTSDPNDRRLIVAGESDTVRVWEDSIRVTHNLRIPDGPTYAVDIDRLSEWVVTAGAGGRARVWQLSRPFTPRFQTTFLHRAPIRDVEISLDGRRMVTADESGQIRLWTFPNATLIDSVDTGVSGAPLLEFSVPDGAILSAYLPDGRLQLYDGRTLTLYRESSISSSGGTAFDIAPEGRPTALGDNNGVITIARAGQCIPSAEDPVCFGGYKIWRNTRPDTVGIKLMRVYGFGDSTWSFVQDVRSFVDPDSVILRRQPPQDDPDVEQGEDPLAGPHDGVPYFYSITRFERHFLNGAVFDVYPTPIMAGFYRDPGSEVPTAIVPRPAGREQTPLLLNVYVVPNPYERGNVPWDAVAGAHVEFRNLPPEATISIHNMAGDQVRVIHHGADTWGRSTSTESWDLKNGSGKEVASGVYVYQVTTPSGEVIQGYFTVIL